MKKTDFLNVVFIVTIFAATVFLSDGCSKSETGNNANAVSGKNNYFASVDGSGMSAGLFNYEFLRFKKLYEKYGGAKFDNYASIMQLKSQVMDIEIAQQMFLNEAKKRGITVPDSEVESRIVPEMETVIGPADNMEGNKTPEDRMKRLRAKLAKEGVTFEDFKQAIRRDLIQQKTVAAIAGDQLAAEKQKAMAKAAEVIAKLKSGAPFDKMAAQYSEDEASRARGGFLGRLKKGMLPETFETPVLNLSPGAFTEQPVETAGGYHVVQLIDKDAEGGYSVRHIFIRVKSQNEIAGDWAKKEREYGKHVIAVMDKELNAYRYLYGGVFSSEPGKPGFDRAAALYKEAAKAAPANPYLYLELGRIYEMKNAKAELSQTRGAKAATGPNGGQTPKNSFMKDALGYYEKAEKVAESKKLADPLLLISLANVQNKLGDAKAAESNYISALNLSAGKEQYLNTIKNGLSGFNSDTAKSALKKTDALLASIKTPGARK
jgi:hypothetical protein